MYPTKILCGIMFIKKIIICHTFIGTSHLVHYKKYVWPLLDLRALNCPFKRGCPTCSLLGESFIGILDCKLSVYIYF